MENFSLLKTIQSLNVMFPFFFLFLKRTEKTGFLLRHKIFNENFRNVQRFKRNPFEKVNKTNLDKLCAI